MPTSNPATGLPDPAPSCPKPPKLQQGWVGYTHGLSVHTPLPAGGGVGGGRRLIPAGFSPPGLPPLGGGVCTLTPWRAARSNQGWLAAFSFAGPSNSPILAARVDSGKAPERSRTSPVLLFSRIVPGVPVMPIAEPSSRSSFTRVAYRPLSRHFSKSKRFRPSSSANGASCSTGKPLPPDVVRP